MKIDTQAFESPEELVEFVNDSNNDVNDIVAICSSSTYALGYVLFYIKRL